MSGEFRRKGNFLVSPRDVLCYREVMNFEAPASNSACVFVLDEDEAIRSASWQGGCLFAHAARVGAELPLERRAFADRFRRSDSSVLYDCAGTHRPPGTPAVLTCRWELT